MKMLLINQSRDRIPSQWLADWLRVLERRLKRQGYGPFGRRELVVVFVTSGEIRRLNRLYRRKDYSTDILSFAPVEKDSLGELVLCLPIIRQQCRRTGLSERGELGYMIVHGVLHLLGFDHEKKDDEAKMFALQDRLFMEVSAGMKRK